MKSNVKFAAERDMDLVRIYDRQVELIEPKIGALARDVHGRDFALIQTVPGIGRI